VLVVRLHESRDGGGEATAGDGDDVDGAHHLRLDDRARDMSKPTTD
jgi:hypothetical protein